MAVSFIDRSKDEEIIDIMNSILSNGNWVVETPNEATLAKLMELRGTPIKIHKSLRDVDSDYNNWVLSK